MLTFTDAQSLQSQLHAWRQAGDRIAFVPTMGNLHEGHLQLVDEARRHAQRTVVSIFVNPTQFGPNEDYASYPRTVEADAQCLRERHVDALFLPTIDVIYPQGQGIDDDCVPPASLTDMLCGLSRPGHFAGVATVVKRLFALLRPDVAVFGEKDYQQLQVIRWLVREHGLPVDIIGMPTVREADGLAMSSRNQYLGDSERQQASRLYAGLQQLCRQLQSSDGPPDFDRLAAEAAAGLRLAGFTPDYVAVRAARDLAPPQPRGEWVILAAAWLGKARLIDNIRCHKDK